MSQNDTRAQRQREQDERRLSIQRDNERPITNKSKKSAILAPTQAPLSVTTTTTGASNTVSPLYFAVAKKKRKSQTVLLHI